jgi:hypothetical protein
MDAKTQQDLKSAFDELVDGMMVDFDDSMRQARKLGDAPPDSFINSDAYNRIARDYYEAGVRMALTSVERSFAEAGKLRAQVMTATEAALRQQNGVEE